jgi:hypothetical protein
VWYDVFSILIPREDVSSYIVNKHVINLLSEISGSHGGEYKDGCLLDCCASLVEVSRRFRAAYCLHHKGDGGSKLF